MATQTIIPGSRITAGAIKDGPGAREKSIYLDPDQMRNPEYTVYLHSISKRSFNQPHPIYRNVVIPACLKDQRYITFMRITHPVQIATVDPDNVSGPLKWFFENAKRVALCVCNPSYVGNDLAAQDKEIANEYQIASSESNLTQQGVFASMNEVPTEEELKKAEARRVNYYKRIFEEMNTLYRSNAKEAADRIGQDHHLAAEMFAIDVDWHKLTTPKVECPNCGEKIKEGIAFHYSNGNRCVLDFERTYLAGAIKKEDVPVEKRWWKEEKSKEQLRQDAVALGIEVDARWSVETLQTKINDALSA